MIRGALAVIVGLIVWGVVATGLDMLLRVALPGYAANEPQLHFTLGMMIARLALPGAVPSVGAGFVSAWISRSDRRAIAEMCIRDSFNDRGVFLALELRVKLQKLRRNVAAEQA